MKEGGRGAAHARSQKRGSPVAVADGDCVSLGLCVIVLLVVSLGLCVPLLDPVSERDCVPLDVKDDDAVSD